MPTITRAAVVRKRRGLFVFEDVQIDDPRPDEVLVRVVATGICHTDIASRDGLLGMPFPAVFGHEGAGIVQKVGTEVTRVTPGDAVVLSFSSCGKCSGCKAGHPANCDDFDLLNFEGSRPDGSTSIRTIKGAPLGSCFFGQSSFAYYALTRERNTIPVDVSGEDELALFSPLGCGLQAGAGTVLNELKPLKGQSFAVFGAGTVGLAALMAAKIAGAGPIAAVDIVPSRLELARELGATLAIDGGKESVGARIREAAGQIVHAVETTGIPRIIDQAIKSLAPAGNLSLLGVSAEDSEEQISPAAPGPDQRVFYSIAGDSHPHTFIPFLIECYREGKFPFDKLIREYPASRINEAVADSLSGVTVKPVLRFDRG